MKLFAIFFDRKLEFTLIEGRNRQIRKIVEAIGMNVVALHRFSFGGIKQVERVELRYVSSLLHVYYVHPLPILLDKYRTYTMLPRTPLPV